MGSCWSWPGLASLMAGALCGLVPVSRADMLSAEVADADMRSVYERVWTPFKYGVILEPEKGCMLDNPCIFRHGERWLMLYIVFDGKGYETQLAESDDLLHWRRRGVVLPRGGEGRWDCAQSDGAPQLLDLRWEGENRLSRFDGKYWMTYIGGSRRGYETDPLSIGVAWTDDPASARPWTRHPRPILTPSDPSARPFERKTLFKSYVIEDAERRLGGRFVMYYNAKQEGKWVERIGMAVSDDMIGWRRVGNGPCVTNEGALDNGLIGDPMVRKIGGLYVMFFFGYNWDGKGDGAFDTFAVSRDLVQWRKWEGPRLVKPSEPWDREHAHKPWVILHGGVVYHFYCAVGDRGRVLALATSRDLRQ